MCRVRAFVFFSSLQASLENFYIIVTLTCTCCADKLHAHRHGDDLRDAGERGTKQKENVLSPLLHLTPVRHTPSAGI